MNQSYYKQLFHFGLLALLISICYSNTLESSWHFDDIPNIVSNQNIQIHNLSWEELQRSFYSPLTKKIGRPVAKLTFAINYLISGLDTTSYHVFNILVHIFTSWFAYLIFYRTLQLYSSEQQHEVHFFSNYDIALFGAVLWAIHPINTQAVTYIVQRMASLATLFYLIAFYCYLRFRVTRGLRYKNIFLLLTICFFFLGIGTKQNTVLLPLAIAGYEIAFFRSKILPESKYVRCFIFILFLLFILFFFWYFNEKISSIVELYNVRKFTLWERLITQPLVLSRYLFLIFYPFVDSLILETDMVASQGLLDPPRTMIAIMFITCLIIFSIVNIKKYPLICFAIYYFFVNHLVESTIIPLELYFEHRNYLPSLFIFLGIAYYSLMLVCYYTKHNKLFLRKLTIFTLMLIMIGEGNATSLRNDVYKNEITLHEDTINKAPINPRPYVAIAVELINKKKFEEGLEYLRKAENLYKKHPDRFQDNWIAKIYYNAGIVFRVRGENEKAISFFLKSVDLDPYEWSAHVNLGILLFAQKDYEHAEDYLYNAVVLHPNCPADLYNLFGRALYANAKYDLAIEVFKKGLEVKDLNVLHYNLVASYLKKGEFHLAKPEILNMSYDKSKTDGVYFLYRALLFPDDERERSLRKIASMLLVNQNDFCDWVTTIFENNFGDVIFPEISDFKDQLQDAYQHELGKIRDHITDQARKVETCIGDKELIILGSE